MVMSQVANTCKNSLCLRLPCETRVTWDTNTSLKGTITFKLEKKTLCFQKLYIILTSPFIIRMFPNNWWYFEKIKNKFEIIPRNTVWQYSTVNEKLCNCKCYTYLKFKVKLTWLVPQANQHHRKIDGFSKHALLTG